MNDRQQDNQGLNGKSRDPMMAGAEAAMRRAAYIARKRAIETTGSVAIYEDGEVVYVTDLAELYGENGEPPGVSQS